MTAVRTANHIVEYLTDGSVTPGGDLEIRSLLCSCFTKPQDAVFRSRRYFHEPYPHRWVIRNERGCPVAHAGAHEKSVMAQHAVYGVAGICEVCVAPGCRGRGMMKALLESVHATMCNMGFVFALLFGDAAVYRSSGYNTVANLYMPDAAEGSDAERPVNFAMARPLIDVPWPTGRVVLPGPSF